MHIAFRVDSSTIIGHGHVMRCLTLAHVLTKHGLICSFISKAHQGNINHLISQHNYQLMLLPVGQQVISLQDTNTWLGCTIEDDVKQCIQLIEAMIPIDCLIVDHYALDKNWHQQIRPFCKYLMIIDDLANRALDCDILLDQTLNRDETQYQGLLPSHCKMLLGQNYMLLRDEFIHSRTHAKAKRLEGLITLTHANILISMGGGDPDNLSQKALLSIESLISVFPKLTVNLIVSSQSEHLISLKSYTDRFEWCSLITDSQDMAKLMLFSDIAIGASGSTAWERCCLGLPSLITINAENQQLIAENLTTAGASINLGWHQKIEQKSISNEIEKLINNPLEYRTMVNNCFDVCDGKGAKRLANTLVTKMLTKGEHCDK